MQMSNEEIVRRYKEAKDKAKQLGILSELNACDRQKIKDILAEGGIDHRQLPRSRKEKDVRPEKAEKTKARPAKEKQAAERLRGVQIECMPAVELMKRFNNKKVLIYLDPPYMPGTRHGKQYRHEMFDEKSHEELIETAKAHKGYVIISGYDTDLYNDMLSGWHKEETTCYSQVCSKKREVIWMNYIPQMQMDMKDFMEM